MYVCTECENRYTTFNKAARCHWGIGGVMTEAEYTEFLASLGLKESILELA